MDAEILKILCCPETPQSLAWAGEALIGDLNRRIEKGELNNRGGKPITEKLDGGLIREDGKFVYPVRRKLPILLVDEGIAVGG